VARPGDQIDLDVNLSQLKPSGLVGPARPEFHWVGSDVWIQGLSAGLTTGFSLHCATTVGQVSQQLL